MCIALSSDEEDNDENSNLPGADHKEEIDVEEFGKSFDNLEWETEPFENTRGFP